jgi:importin-5
VLLRRVAFKTYKHDNTTTVWDAAADGTKHIVKRGLLEGFEQETVPSVRNKICDTIGDVAREEDANSRNIPQMHSLITEPWPELLNALFQSTKSAQPAHRESAFRVFAALPTLVDKQHIDLLKSLFLQGLQDPAPKVRFVATRLTQGTTVRAQSRVRILHRL